MLENSQAKLAKKNADMIVANNLKVAGAGFAGDTNVVTIITHDGVRELPLMSKQEAAHQIVGERLSPGWIKRRESMQEIELLPSSEQDNRYIHQQLRQYNRQFMRDFKDYSFSHQAGRPNRRRHRRRQHDGHAGGRVSLCGGKLPRAGAGTAAAGAGRKSRPPGRLQAGAAQHLQLPGTRLLPPNGLRAAGPAEPLALASTASTTSPKTCECKKKRSLSASLF